MSQVSACTRRLRLTSTKNPVWRRKSAPRMGFVTRASRKDHSVLNLPIDSLMGRCPNVSIGVPLAAARVEVEGGSVLSAWDAGNTLTAAPVSTK